MLIGSGVHGIIIGGSTGEYYAHSPQERFDLAAYARGVIGTRLPLVVGTGAIRTEDLVAYARAAREIKADAGYTVNVIEFAEWGIAYAALTKGDIQILASQTDYVAQDYWNKNKSRLEKISPVSHGLYQSIAVPSYVTINSIEELNPNADKFGGKIVGIEPGSGLMRDTETAVDEYGLDLELVEAAAPERWENTKSY